MNPCTLSGFPSHLHHIKRLLGYTKAGEENTLGDLYSSADLNQHCRLQDRGLERWGRSQGLAADRCFPTKAPSVSESKSLELQSHGLQTQQPIPGGVLASEVRPIWTTDRSLSDLRKVVQLPGASAPLEEDSDNGNAIWLSVQACVLTTILCGPVYMCAYVHVCGCTCAWRSKDNLGGQSSDVIHCVFWVCFLLFYSLSLVWSLLSRLGWLSSNPWGSTCLCFPIAQF